MHPILNPTNGHMALVAGIGLGLMGLSVPGRFLARLLLPISFFGGLGVVVWALFRHAWIAELLLLALIALGFYIERKRDDGDAEPSQPFRSIEFGEPFRATARSFHLQTALGTLIGDPFTPIVLPVTARGANIVNCRSTVHFKSPSFEHEMKGRWENRAQPTRGVGEDWSVFNAITLLRDEDDAIAIAVQHEGDARAFMLSNRSWEMPLQHGQNDFRHPDHELPAEPLLVLVTVRGDDMNDCTFEFALSSVNGTWQPSPKGTEPPVAYDPAQMRRAISGAITQLRKQRALVWEWRLHPQLEPDERGEWETEDRKGILHQDPRFGSAFQATEDAFNAIALMKDPTNYHRETSRHQDRPRPQRTLESLPS